jgi:NitT/TauT family transport system substrate-binding protein
VAIDLTEKWNATPNATTLVQGCVVVRKEFAEQYPDSVAAFMQEYKASIEYINTNPAEGAKMIVDNGIFANENVAKKALPKCNIAYMDGNDMKTAMNGFLNAMMTVAPASIGNAIPGDDFYYMPQ